jgi:hypothetical protein
LWQVAQGDAERRAKSLFECPVCRSEHCVAHADLDAFLAAHLASNFGAPEAGGPGATSRSSLRRSEEGLATFTVPELRIVVDELRLNVRDAIDRSDIERAAERQLERKVPLGTTAPRTLLARALLALTTTHANVLTIGLLAAITAIAITVLDIGLVVGISGSVRIPLIAPDCLRLPLMAPDGI